VEIAGGLTGGPNVIREREGDWWYVTGPGLDEPILAVKRDFEGATEVTQAWLPVVSDGRGQLIAIADSGGQLQGNVTTLEYDAGLWNSSGLTGNSRTFNPRRWATPGGIDTISTFRSRQYDPATGRWLQEDPIGVAGGVNLYQYNGNDPNSFGDPFGLIDCPHGQTCRRYTFGHLSEVDVQQQTSVTPGAIIGRTGNTGASTGPHLHYEVGTVDAEGRYAPDYNASITNYGCPFPMCPAPTSTPSTTRHLIVNGQELFGHPGIDLPVSVGTPVHAPLGGEVLRAGPQDPNNLAKGLGNRVTIDVPNINHP
jgi:RHS repeat-associated protein